MTSSNRRIVLIALLLTGTVFVRESLANPLGGQSSERLTTDIYFSLESKWDRAVLVASGRTDTGARIEKRRLLSEKFSIEERHYRISEVDPGEDERTRTHRVLYRHRGRAYIAGAHGKIASYPWVEWASMGGTLMNVPHGFDVEKQQIWIEPRPEEMPPLPVPFKTRSWKGLRFGIPYGLERFQEQEARAIVELRGGLVVEDCNEPVDVVLIADDTDFMYRRNELVERWMRQGAQVMWEKDFPGPQA